MMIRHNDRHTQFSGIGNLLHSGYSVITGDDRIHACIISSLYQLPGSVRSRPSFGPEYLYPPALQPHGIL